MRKLAPLVCLAATLAATPAAAEPEGQGGGTPTELARGRDASVDRGFLTAHAETIGEDNWTFNAYELIFVGLTYGFSNDIQASFSTLLPVTTDIPLVIAIQPKFVLMRSAETIIALRTPVSLVSDLDGDDETVVTFGAGVLVDQRLDDAGRFAIHAGLLVSGAAGAGFDLTDGLDLAEGAFFELDLGLTLGVASIVKIIVEAQAFAGVSDAGFEVADVVLLNYGVRFHSGTLAGDLGFIRPIGVDTDLLLGVPYLAFTAKF